MDSSKSQIYVLTAITSKTTGSNKCNKSVFYQTPVAIEKGEDPMRLSPVEMEEVSRLLNCSRAEIQSLLDDSSIEALPQPEASDRLRMSSADFNNLMRYFRARAVPLITQENYCLAAELSSGRLLITTTRCWWRFLKYKPETAEMENWETAGVSFASALARLDKIFSDDPLVIRMMASVGWRSYFDLELVQLPYWGGVVEVPPELIPAFFRSALIWQVRNLNPTEFDAVIEIGCGVGSLIVSLASEFRSSTVRFIGTDISQHALRCTSKLGKIAGVSIETYELDLENPNFNWLEDCRRVLVVSSGVLCSLDGPPVKFFDRLVGSAVYAKLLLFEPVGLQIRAKVLNDEAVPSMSHAINRDLNFAIWNEIEERSKRKEISIDRLVADFASRMPSFPHSLIELTCNSSTAKVK